MVYTIDNLPEGVTYTSTGRYSGFFTTTDPARRFVVLNDDVERGAEIASYTTAPHLVPLTFDEAVEKITEYYEEAIDTARKLLSHYQMQSEGDYDHFPVPTSTPKNVIPGVV